MKIAEAVALGVVGLIVACAILFSIVLASGATDESIIQHGITYYKFFLGSETVHLSRDEIMGIAFFAISAPIYMLLFIRQGTL